MNTMILNEYGNPISEGLESPLDSDAAAQAAVEVAGHRGESVWLCCDPSLGDNEIESDQWPSIEVEPGDDARQISNSMIDILEEGR
jgi:hypothetical protein